MNYIVMITICK